MKPVYLFLDTQVFDSNAYDFENKHFKSLRALGESGQIYLVMPEITRREIERHIGEKAKDTYGMLDKLRRSGYHRNLRNPPFDTIAKEGTVESIREELMAQFNEFCKEAHVTHLPAKGVDLAAVLDDYFAQKPPFSGKKKHEFPDAFSAHLLTHWCKKHGRKAVVVSGDDDWVSIKDERLEVLDTIAKFLDRFPDPIVANQIRAALKGSKCLINELKRKFEELEFRDRHHNVEVTDLVVSEVVVGEFYVTDITDGVATVETDVSFTFSAMVTGRTRLHSFRNDDGYGEDDVISTKIHSQRSTTATIEAHFDKDPSDIDPAVSLGGISRYIDVGILFE